VQGDEKNEYKFPDRMIENDEKIVDRRWYIDKRIEKISNIIYLSLK
jgi:hypothetical protein